MKSWNYETVLGVLLLSGLLLLSTKGVERVKNQNLHMVSQDTAIQQETIETELPKYTVVIDAGHGGEDPGKIGINDALEKDINLSIAKKLKTCLEKENVRVVMTRENEEGLYKEGDSNKKQADMSARCDIIHDAEADLTVSVHQNSYTSEVVSGPQVFYHAQSVEGERAARLLQDALNTRLAIARPREIKANNTYYILKKTKTPVVIAECGFLSNSAEAAKLVTEAYQQQVAEALAEGVLKFLEDV